MFQSTPMGFKNKSNVFGETSLRRDKTKSLPVENKKIDLSNSSLTHSKRLQDEHIFYQSLESNQCLIRYLHSVKWLKLVSKQKTRLLQLNCCISAGKIFPKNRPTVHDAPSQELSNKPLTMFGASRTEEKITFIQKAFLNIPIY